MTIFQIFGAAWLGTTVVLIAAFIHRAILGFREDDQLFLAPGEKELERQQVSLSQRMNRLTGRIHSLAFASLVGSAVDGRIRRKCRRNHGRVVARRARRPAVTLSVRAAKA